ncbi:radical SAM protein, partial [Pseudomonas sp. BGM005]|nr:radical SAM protein [Pseudomonas sp. BG5]
EASPRLIEEAGLYADRLSLNIELPTDTGITRFAPEKKPANIRRSMGELRLKIEAADEPTLKSKKRQRFVPAGQSTQMIVGADGASDATILATSGR